MDSIQQKHVIYYLLLFFSWAACCVVFGGELHRASIKQTDVTTTASETITTVTDVKVHLFYDHYSRSGSVTQTRRSTTGTRVTESPQSGSVNFNQCTSISLCDRCYSGGAGAIAMAVFAFLGLTLAAFLRAMVQTGKYSQIPRLGANDSTYALVERGTNYTLAGFYILSIVAWGGGCMSATANETGVSEVIPTGLIYVVLCLASVFGAIYVLHKLHEESGFGLGGSISKPTATATPAPAPATNAV